jgi:hypothetical protein
MNQSRLLKLPAELRHIIYEFVFSDLEYDITTGAPASALVARHQHPPHAFALLRASRQIYAEISLLPYNMATFQFYNRNMLDIFFRALSSQQVAAVRRVRFVVKFMCWDEEGSTWESLAHYYPEVWPSLVGVMDLHLLVERMIEESPPLTKSPPMTKLVTLLVELKEEVQKKIPGLKKLTFASYRDEGDGWDVVKEMEERIRASAIT